MHRGWTGVWTGPRLGGTLLPCLLPSLPWPVFKCCLLGFSSPSSLTLSQGAEERTWLVSQEWGSWPGSVTTFLCDSGKPLQRGCWDFLPVS